MFSRAYIAWTFAVVLTASSAPVMVSSSWWLKILHSSNGTTPETSTITSEVVSWTTPASGNITGRPIAPGCSVNHLPRSFEVYVVLFTLLYFLLELVDLRLQFFYTVNPKVTAFGTEL